MRGRRLRAALVLASPLFSVLAFALAFRAVESLPALLARPWTVFYFHSSRIDPKIFSWDLEAEGMGESESETSETSHNDPSLRRRCGSSLADVSARGVAFIDAWDVANEERAALDKELSPGIDVNCVNRLIVNVSFAPHGLGSNLIVLADFVLYGVLRTNSPLITVTIAHRTHANSLQTQLLSSSAFFVEGSTLAPSSLACTSKTCTETKLDGRDFWKVSMNSLIFVYREKLKWFSRARTHLWRSFLRLKPEVRKALDARVAQALGPAVEHPVLCIHIRRSDKVGINKESKYVETMGYLRAASTLSGKVFKTVVTVSDDAGAGDEVQRDWKQVFPDYQPRFIARFNDPISMRPDRISSRDAEQAKEAFEILLTDLRLMIEADYFVGSMNSNLALIACSMNGDFSRCRNIDLPEGSFEWKEEHIKLV